MRRLLRWWRERKEAQRREASALNMAMAIVQMVNPDAPEPPYIKNGGAWVPPWHEEQAERLLDIISGRIPTCPECGGVLTYLDDVDISYCTDPACLWNQEATTKAIEERYQ